LFRHYDIFEGELTLDGVSIKDLDYVWYRDLIGTVAQEPALFSSSILDNISYGKKNCTKEEVYEAAKRAYAHEFIMEFPEQYETLVGEKGVRLSGGQKQRVAIARAILKNPKIIILDEYTSALDSESEYFVKEALKTLMKGKTTLIIAHRLSTIKNADMVCVVDKGKIIEKGTHNELINEDGFYKNLVQKQLLFDIEMNE
jgi:ABC-type multidrug transport system fused ATPase/permease subunit